MFYAVMALQVATLALRQNVSRSASGYESVMAHFPHGSSTKGKCPVCPMIRRRYLAGMFVKEQAADDSCLVCGKGNADSYIVKS